MLSWSNVWTHRLPPTPHSAGKHSRTLTRNFPERVLRADLDLLFRRFFLLHWNPAFRSYWMKPDFVMMWETLILSSPVRDSSMGKPWWEKRRLELQNCQKNTANLSLRSQAVLQKMHLHATPPELMPFSLLCGASFHSKKLWMWKMRQKIWPIR